VSRLRKIIRPPPPGAIVATLALFLALGGGALAFSGSGTLQKENEIGLPESPAPAETIREIKGIGDIRADCVGDNPRVLLHNSSGKTLVVRLDRGPALSWGDAIADGGNVDVGIATQDHLYQYHVAPAGTSKRPQASITVAIDSTVDCNTAQVAVINVTTEE
jgi:hypothetical protein